MAAMKLGKLDPTYDARDLKLAHYLGAAALPRHPLVFGHEGLVHEWNMLANDNYGDCVFAGAAHETMLWHAESVGSDPRYALRFTDEGVLSDYSAVTGFDPNDPSTDRGTSVRQALSYRRKTGIIDADGVRHQILGYVALEPGNWDHVLDSIYLFGATGIGIKVPSSAMDQFKRGEPWSVVSAPGAIEGGHYIPLVAWRGRLLCVTWGKLQPMTRGFFEKYCDESWGILDDELLQQGRSPEGFRMDALLADLKLLAA